MFTVTLSGDKLENHVLGYEYKNTSTPSNYKLYIEPKDYFKEYMSKIILMTTGDTNESFIEMITKHGEDLFPVTPGECLFDTDIITFSFDNEEEALYFELKYNY